MFKKTSSGNSLIIFALICAIILINIGCSQFSRKQQGAVIGVTTGGVVGGVIGKKAGNTAVGAILGTAIGGAAGAYIGDYMDKQAEEIEKEVEGAEVERVGEGIHIIFDSGILFAVDSTELNSQSKDNLEKFGEIQKKYEKTDILVEGHTDSTGSSDYNQTLSERRSQAVANYLMTLGVSPDRFTIRGYGESQPIASNDTPEGRQANRRVEIAILADEKLKDEAREKTAG